MLRKWHGSKTLALTHFKFACRLIITLEVGMWCFVGQVGDQIEIGGQKHSSPPEESKIKVTRQFLLILLHNKNFI